MKKRNFPLELHPFAAGVHALALARKRFTTGSKRIEKDVKQAVKEIVAEMAPDAHVFMPVQAGFGATDLDFIISINGFALRIETKIDGKKPSARQWMTIDKLTVAGVPVLVIDQYNLQDVCITVNSLLRGQQGNAFDYAGDNRKEYAGS